MTPNELPETYSFVLQRFDRDTGHLSPRIRFAAGNVNVQSYKASSMRLGAKGDETAHTLFFPELRPAFMPGVEASMNRAIRMGWVNVTEKWAKFLKGELEVAVDPVATPPQVQKQVEEREVPKVEPKVEPKPGSKTMTELEDLGWRELQALAKSLNIKAGGVARADMEQAVFTALQEG